MQRYKLFRFFLRKRCCSFVENIISIMEFNLLSVGAERSKETRKWFWGVEMGRFQKNEESEPVPIFCLFWDGTALLLDVFVWEFVLFEKK